MADPMDNHKCKMIARSDICGEGREFWIGELLEPIEGHSRETHCIHITTPHKSVVFGVMSADAAIMAVAAQIIHKETYGKPINQNWVDRVEMIFRDCKPTQHIKVDE